jgi:uncharacterized protein YuzE
MNRERPARRPLAERLKVGMEALIEGTDCRTTYVSNGGPETLLYEQETDTLYILATRENVAKTVPITPYILMDTDEHGSLVGLKLLNASIQLAKVPITRRSEQSAA